MMQMLKRLSVLAVALSVFATGCGGGAHHAAVHHPAALSLAAPHSALATSSSQSCPPGDSRMGCGLHVAAQNPTTVRVGAPSGALFPDVSNWQGNVNWPAVAGWQDAHHWKRAAVFKLGEYVLDAYASRNAAETKRLRFWRAGYWFIRNTGCAHEASLIIWAAHRYGLTVVVLDSEVPEAGGYTTCLVPALKRAGFVVVIYSGTGTWPGGNAFGSPLWMASYGLGFGCLWTCRPAAWQFTDGQHGSPTYVPGVGYDDVSVDFGITKLGVKPKPRSHCLADPYPHTRACGRIRYGYHHLVADRNKVALRLRQHHCFARRHPRYCRGWAHAANVDYHKLAAYLGKFE